MTLWSEVMDSYQLKAGAGDIYHSWLKSRRYLFDGEVRGELFNRGTMPGTYLGTHFTLFIIRDPGFTNKNKAFFSLAAYSDDRSPVFEQNAMESGNAQKAPPTSGLDREGAFI
jgi:hypothetical protein